MDDPHDTIAEANKLAQKQRAQTEKRLREIEERLKRVQAAAADRTRHLYGNLEYGPTGVAGYVQRFEPPGTNDCIQTLHEGKQPPNPISDQKAPTKHEVRLAKVDRSYPHNTQVQFYRKLGKGSREYYAWRKKDHRRCSHLTRRAFDAAADELPDLT